MDNMNYYRCYEQVKDVDDMNNSGSWAQGFSFYEQLRFMVDMKNIGLLA